MVLEKKSKLWKVYRWTDDGQQMIRKAHFRFRWAKNVILKHLKVYILWLFAHLACNVLLWTINLEKYVLFPDGVGTFGFLKDRRPNTYTKTNIKSLNLNVSMIYSIFEILPAFISLALCDSEQIGFFLPSLRQDSELRMKRMKENRSHQRENVNLYRF